MASSAGRTLGRYRLERLVGRGGMAEVWEARDQTLGRRVAVKIIAPALAADARFHERFLSEARSVAALEHGNVLPIYDFGESEGVPYLVMPFVESGTLAERLKQAEVQVEEAIDWIRQIASALDAAHEAGVLHRDVKPANVMIGAGGRLLLADFGIAKSSQSGQLTATGLALGTPAYMAPELARGEPATPSSDRYAMGVLAYELLCGRPPFAGDNALALLHQHLTTPVPTVSGARADLPGDLDPAFARILAKDPEERPPTCAALAEEIERAFGRTPGRVEGPAAPRPIASSRSDDVTLADPVSGAPATPVTRRMPPAPATTSSPGDSPSRAAAASRPRAAVPRRAAPILGAAVVLALISGILLWAMRQRSGGAVPSEEVATNVGPPIAVDSEEPPRADAVAGPSGAASTATSAIPVPTPHTAVPRPDVAPDRAADEVPATAATSAGRPAPGRWAMPPAEALAIFDLIDDAWRKGRFQPSLFTDIEPRLAALRRTAGATPGVELLEGWVAGGKALVAGNRDRAREDVRSFFSIEDPPEWASLLPARFLARHQGGVPLDWQVALFWGDPRGEARALVDAARRGAADDRNLLLARAVVEHLDGRHREAARQAVALDPLLRQGPVRRVLARFAGDQLLWSDDVPGAISWYKKMLVAPERTEITAVVRTLSEEGGPQLVARACAEGFLPACDASRAPSASRPRRARRQP